MYTTVLVHWVSDMGNATCDVVQTFRTGEESEFKVLSDGTYSWPGTCRVGILRKLKDGTWQEVQGFKREYEEPWWYGGQWSFCEADPVYQGSSLLMVPRGKK